MNTGYIERTYTPCADDMGGNANNTVATGDARVTLAARSAGTRPRPVNAYSMTYPAMTIAV
jgi:hypothetical protein